MSDLKLLLEKRKSEFVEGVTNEEYHADRTAIGSTTLNWILNSPAKFYYNYFNPKREKSDLFNLGTAVHLAVLEFDKFRESHAVMPDFGDGRTKAAKDAKLEWQMMNENKLHISMKDFNCVIGVMESIHKNNYAMSLFKSSRTEISGYANDPTTGIAMKMRADILRNDNLILTDFKTSECCYLDNFSWSIWNYKYYFQSAYYSEVVKLITGKYPDHCIYLVAEKEPPYEIAIYSADEVIIEIGKSHVRKALDTLKYCIDNNVWPQQQKEIQNISLPRSVIMRLENEPTN